MIENLQSTTPEISGIKPYWIRGHHLKNFVSLLKSENPEFEAYAITLDIENLKISSRSQYAVDVIGDSYEDSLIFEENLKNLFKVFLSLPDDHPAKITEDIPDDICGLCVVGNHCREKIPWYGPTKDSASLDKFLRTLNTLELPTPEIEKVNSPFHDPTRPEVRIANTTMGIVREVLPHLHEDY